MKKAALIAMLLFATTSWELVRTTTLRPRM
jgi:hypothetical protein